MTPAEYLADFERRKGYPYGTPPEQIPLVRRPVEQPVAVRNSAPPPANGKLSPAMKAAIREPECVHLGTKIPGKPCGSQLMRCDLHRDITTRLYPCEGAQRCCLGCPQKRLPLPGLTPRWTHQFGPGLVGDKHQTNCSLMPFDGRLLLAYRTGWMGSRIHVTEIGPGMVPGRSKTLNLNHRLGWGGREDPRLFLHDGELYLSYIGVRVRGGKTVARQLFAWLTDDLEVEDEWEPQYAASPEWEKNWQPFSADGRLRVVYSMRPWRILELDGDGAELVAEHPGVPWKYGLPRGGAAPVLHNGEWYAFFHGTDKSGEGKGKPAIYTAGVCTFSAEAPHHPLRITREPILWPVMSDLPPGPANGRWYAATAFPCGAYLDHDQWVVSYGHNDHWCRVSAFGFEEIEERLMPV